MSIASSLLPLLKSKNITLKNLSHIVLLFVLAGLFSACLKNEICSPVAIELQAGIYTISETDGVFDTVPAIMDIDTLRALSMPESYLLLDATAIEVINLPFNNATNLSRFILSVGDSKDTIDFTYDKELLFNSVKCGVSYSYTITNYYFTTNLIQDIILINPEIDVISAENIQLVF